MRILRVLIEAPTCIHTASVEPPCVFSPDLQVGNTEYNSVLLLAHQKARPNYESSFFSLSLKTFRNLSIFGWITIWQ